MRKAFLFILALCATTLAWGATTVTKTAKEIAAANGWTKVSTAYATAKLDDVITITVTPGTGDNKNGMYYTGDYTDTHDWRMYQARANGQFAIKAAQGYVITSVTLTYEVTNTGVVSTAVKETGVATPAANQILSETAYSFANSELTFYVGNTTAATTKGQARIRKFSVTYEKGIVENFKTPDGTDWSFNTSATSVEGKYYTWTLTKCRHENNGNDATKSHGAGVGMWKNNSSSFVTTAEGGVKAIAFYWNQMSANESNKTDKLAVWLNGTAQSNQAITGTTADKRGEDVLCILTPTTGSAPTSWPKDNCELKLTPGGHTEARVTFGPITIVPYLRYTYTEMQEVKIGEGTFDCSLQIDNTDGEGSITYSSDNACVSFDDANIPTAKLNGAGTAHITATWSEGASTSFTLNVIAKDIPEVKFASETVNVTDLYTTAPVTNALTVTDGAGDAAYTCDNPLVAKIVGNQVYVVGVGTATITATTAENDDFVPGSASYTLNVAEPTGETAIDIAFGTGLTNTESGDKKYIKSDDGTEVTSTNGLYDWLVNNYRYNNTWVRLATTDEPYLKFDGNQEGGIKRLVFNWFRAGGTPVPAINTKITVVDGETQLAERSIVFGANDAHGSLQPYNVKMGVKQNAQLIINNFGSPAVMHFQDIKIIPYLLYTQKSDELIILASEAEATYKNEAFINNTGATPTFSIISSEPASIATIAEDGTVTATASGTITVQAKWENVTTTYTLNITKNSLPVPQVSFEYDPVEKTMNDVPFVNAITAPTEGLGAITYSSTDPTVAEVATDGTVTIIGAGETKIQLAIAASETWAATDAEYTLTITDPQEEAIIETFVRNSGGSSTNDRVGDYYTWKITTGARTKTTDVLFNETPAIWLAGNGGASMETTIEGGIKRVSFLWNKFSANPTSISLDVTAGEVTRSLTREVAGGVNQNNPDLVFNSNFGVKSNAKLKIANPQNTTALQIGPIKITPYLYYTDKSKSFDVADGEIPTTYTNEDLINNIDEGTVSYAITDENGIASNFNTSTGEITFDEDKQGTATVTASWEDVTTSYTITVVRKQDLTVSFAQATQKVTIGQSYTLQEMQLSALSDGAQSYTSSDNTVAEVEDGVLTIKKVGTVTITGTVDETTTYKSGSASYVLAILPNETDVISETYGNIPDAGVTHDRTDYKGDYDLTWYYRNGRSKSTDEMVSGDKAFWFCHVVTDKTEKYKSSYIETTFEGGIKAVYFDWKSASVSNNNNLIKMEIKADGTKVDEISVIGAQSHIDNDQPYSFSMEQKKSVKLTIANVCRDAADENDIEGKLALGPITIVPYLFYTTKVVPVTYDLEGTNEVDASANLINNLEEGETVTYSLSAGAQATIVGSTITLDNATEDVIVTAKWADGDNTITTTFTLKVTKAAEPALTRDDLSSGQLITVCLNKNITSVEGGTFYQIEQGTTSVITFAEFAEEDFPIAKATPLLFQSDGTEMKVYCGTDQVADADKNTIVEHRAMKGLVNTATTEQTLIAVGNIIVSGGQLHLVGGYCVFTPGHAYIDVEELANLEPLQPTLSGAPRRTMTLYNPDAAPTNLVESESESGKAMKVLRDGQFYIIRDTKTYNAQGILVE